MNPICPFLLEYVVPICPSRCLESIWAIHVHMVALALDNTHYLAGTNEILKPWGGYMLLLVRGEVFGSIYGNIY